MIAPAWLYSLGLSASPPDASAGRDCDTRRSAPSPVRAGLGGLRRAAAALLLGLPLLFGLAAGAQAQTAKTLEFLGFRTGGTGNLGSFDGTYEVDEGKLLFGKIRMNGFPNVLAGVGVRVKGGTATAGQDYGWAPYGWRVTVHKDSGGYGWFWFRITDDAVADDVETIELEFFDVQTAPGYYNPDGTIATTNHGTATITIRDYTSTDPNDYNPKQLLWLSKGEHNVTEGGGTRGEVRILNPRGVDTTISLTEHSSTATSGTDYAAGPYSVTIPAGKTSAAFWLHTMQDEDLESQEAFTLEIDTASLPVGYEVGTGSGQHGDARVKIDDDEYQLSFDLSSYTVREDAGELVATLRYSRPLPKDSTVKFVYTDVSAIGWDPRRPRPAAYDYTQKNAFPIFLNIPAGTEEFTFRVPIHNDNVYEQNEIFKIRGIPKETVFRVPDADAEVIIRSTDPEVDFQASAFTAHEGRDAVVTFRVVERGTDELQTLRKPTTLHVAAKSSGTATAGTDYAAGPWTLTIPKGASKGVLRIPVHADSASDDGETIELEIKTSGRMLADQSGTALSGHDHIRIRAGSGWAEGAATVTIKDSARDPGTPVVWIEPDSSQVTEGTDATFTLKADPAPLADLDVSIHVGEATQARHVADEHLGLRTATITAGSDTGTLTVPTVAAAGTGAVRVVLMGPDLLFATQEPDYSVGRPSEALVGVDGPAPLSAPPIQVPASQVSNVQATAVDAGSARVTWDAVEHATFYRVEWEGDGQQFSSAGALPGITGTTATIDHQAQEAMTLTLKVIPAYVDGNGDTQLVDDLAGTTTLEVGPAGTQGSDDRTTVPNACVSAGLQSNVEGYAAEDYGDAHVARWQRVLNAFAGNAGGMTGAEARQMEKTYSASRWGPVAEAIECLEAASQPTTDNAALGADPYAALIAKMYEWRNDAKWGRYKTHTDRWDRALLAFGESVSDTSLTPMTADEAQAFADKGMTRWVEVAAALHEIESGGGTTTATSDPELRLTAGSAVGEGGNAEFTLTADPAPEAALTVKIAVAQSGDYLSAPDPASRTVTLAAGATSMMLTLATVDDGTDEPDGSVSVTVDAGNSYTVAESPNDTAQVTVADNDAAVAGVPSLSIVDGQAHENEGRLPFTIRLSPASKNTVSVWLTTRESDPVSAREGVDYRGYGRWGTRVTFRPGETERRLAVRMINDSHDEDAETFEVVLTDPGGGAVIADGTGVMTIVNSDPMPAAWLSRFGRTVAQQVLDGIANRMAAPRTQGAQGTIAGQTIRFGTEAGAGDPARGERHGNAPHRTGRTDHPSRVPTDLAPAFATSANPLNQDGFAQNRFSQDPLGHDAQDMNSAAQTLTMQELLLGSSFTATGGVDASGATLAFWGRAARSSFDGFEGTFSLDGDTTTALLGADYARGKWLFGLAFTHSEGDGDYRDIESTTDAQECGADTDPALQDYLCDGAVREGDGEVEASLTAVIPYVALQASPRMKLWGAVGRGEGDVELEPEPGGSLKSDIDWTMIAAGLRSELLSPAPAGSGLALALTSDALWASTESDRTHELASSDSEVTRVRLGLEGSYSIALDTGGQVIPKIEVGARHDGGDAETGTGLEIGAGLSWSDPHRGLHLDLSGRTLITHAEDDLEDEGVSVSFSYDPRPDSARGLSLTLHQEMGGPATGGLDALFAPDPLSERTGSEQDARLRLEAAYGLAAGPFIASPHMGLGMASGARDYVLGWRLTPAAPDRTSGVFLEVKGTRLESDGAPPVHTLGVEATLRW